MDADNVLKPTRRAFCTASSVDNTSELIKPPPMINLLVSHISVAQDSTAADTTAAQWRYLAKSIQRVPTNDNWLHCRFLSMGLAMEEIGDALRKHAFEKGCYIKRVPKSAWSLVLKDRELLVDACGAYEMYLPQTMASCPHNNDRSYAPGHYARFPVGNNNVSVIWKDAPGYLSALRGFREKLEALAREDFAMIIDSVGRHADRTQAMIGPCCSPD